ncbi:MAG: bifunctional [glutamate--ammonia ligase]-adenylyl-L-tyrosine phosphorylase/[glutamate--ammonia-ligase] adenylyltransferase, partial [Desulfobacca sp.]|nr:bifunctional [glutamate--ammonia ligase]-adenylyl-L-tyrosine phosphorylase/[glutamate--ammonia-ligase] adenylyltransferase [Desulfobacca sp.]
MTQAHQLQKKIEDFSPYLTHIMRRDSLLAKRIFDQQGYLEKKSPNQIAEGLDKKIAGAEDFQTFCLLLRHYKQEEILRIAARDLEGLAGLNETTENLSALARICLQASITFCLQDPTGFKKTPFPLFLEEGLIVLGMGKLGGLELNFSSDIDLIFLYHPSPKVSIPPPEQKEALQIMTRRVIQAMGSQMDGDHVFRVDLGLRPGGKDSDLVLSLESALEYYQTSARTWERLAFIKARPMAGNINLGKSFLKEIQPIIYRKFVDYSVLAEIRSMKQKILTETRAHLLKGDDIKLGPGGIREIEFIVQTLQLVFGGKVPTIRERNTLKALIKLKEAQILPKEECRQLTQGYSFLRTLEHRIQMVHQRQTHSLPHQPEALESIARQMSLKISQGLGPIDGLMQKLDLVREKVRIAFDNLLLAHTPISQEQISALLLPTTLPEDRGEKLAALGFHQVTDAQDIIESWTKRLASSSIREKNFLTKVFPLLLGYCLQTLNPDQGLAFIDRFLRNIGGRIGIMAMLLERNALAKEIVELFAQSAMMGRLFIQNPEMMDHLALQRTLGRPSLTEGSFTNLKSRGRSKDQEEQLSELRRLKSGYFLETALEEIAGRLPSSEASEKLSFLADQVLIETTRLAEETLNQEVVHPLFPERSTSTQSSPFCILGLGKLGGQELGYASDLDLIFVYSLKTHHFQESPKSSSILVRKGDKKWITYHEYLVRLAQRLISYLSLPLKPGPGYSVDTRLRPSGSFGPLIVTLDAFRDYYQNQAQNWERQALLKARVIVGPPPLGDQVREVMEQVLYNAPPSPQVRREMAYFRNRMEKERSGENRERFNPKLGYGGLTDIDFIAQYLQWTYGQTEPDLRQTNTLKVLKALKTSGHLTDDTHFYLKEAYQFLNRLDHGLQLLYDRKSDPRTYGLDELTLITKQNLLGLGEGGLPS